LIYLVRKSALGDVLWIEPVIRQLAERYKKVIVFTKYNTLFENYPLPGVQFRNSLNFFEKVWNRMESFFKFSFRFINLDMSYENDTKKHILHAYQKKAGLPLTNEYPILHLSAEEQKPFPDLPAKYVVLHLESFTTQNSRRVYGVQWEKVTEHLHKLGYEVIQVGKQPDDIAGTRFVKTSIREMIRLIRHCSFFIGIDSGPSHIAASLQKPSLVFFGAVNPLYRHFPEKFNGFFLQQHPCEFGGCYHEANSIWGRSCRLVGDDGIPKCSLYSAAYVTSNINLLMNRYIDHA